MTAADAMRDANDEARIHNARDRGAMSKEAKLKLALRLLEEATGYEPVCEDGDYLGAWRSADGTPHEHYRQMRLVSIDWQASQLSKRDRVAYLASKGSTMYGSQLAPGLSLTTRADDGAVIVSIEKGFDIASIALTPEEADKAYDAWGLARGRSYEHSSRKDHSAESWRRFGKPVLLENDSARWFLYGPDEDGDLMLSVPTYYEKKPFVLVITARQERAILDRWSAAASTRGTPEGKALAEAIDHLNRAAASDPYAAHQANYQAAEALSRVGLAEVATAREAPPAIIGAGLASNERAAGLFREFAHDVLRVSRATEFAEMRLRVQNLHSKLDEVTQALLAASERKKEGE